MSRRFAALLLIVALLAVLVAPVVAVVARGAAGPVCIGIIVTSCSVEPPRSSPTVFLAVLILGAWGTLWLSRALPDGEDEGDEEEVKSTELEA